MTVFVLWEDKALGEIERFGPHTFLVACVAARLTMDRHRLMRSRVIAGKPCGGNSNVLRQLAGGPLWDSAMFVVAVLDTDRIHDRLGGIPSRRSVAEAAYGAWMDSVAAAVQGHAPQDVRNQLTTCVLDYNLETLLSLVGRGRPDLDRALAKDRLARDKILYSAASDGDLVHRACAEMPSWDALVTTVTRLLESSMELIADDFFRDR